MNSRDHQNMSFSLSELWTEYNNFLELVRADMGDTQHCFYLNTFVDYFLLLIVARSGHIL